jgi:hypothetical protein
MCVLKGRRHEPDRLRAGIAAVAALAAAACAAEPVALTRLRETPTAYTQNSGFTDPARIVVRDDDEWRRVWGRIRAGSEPPAVDFAANMALVAALGTKRSGGFDIRIESLDASNGEWLVTVVEHTPAPGCQVLAALTSPADVVVVPRSDAEVAFRTVAAQTRC